MAIIQDENILAEDFINESEKDATPANDEGRVAKLEDDGKISPVFLQPIDVQEFTTSGTWTKPSNGGARVFVQMWGGGGGGSHRTSGSNVVQGGGGGEYIAGWFSVDDLSATETVTVGAGGTAGGSSGGVGGNSLFGDLITANGGEGATSSSGSGIARRAGGGQFLLEGFYGSATTPDAFYSGGSSGNSVHGGAGGGESGAGGTSVFGGDGGAGSLTDSVNGEDGEVPAGGGGGHRADVGIAGAGGGGKVIITTY